MNRKSFIVSLVILAATTASVYAIASRGVPRVVRTNLENIPMEIGEYRAVEDFFPESIYRELNADRHVYRHYRKRSGVQVDLYIGYYGTAKGGRTGHNPYGCLPGSGWGILETGTVRVSPDYYPNGININYILSQKEQVYECILHWYQSAGTKILARGIEQNIDRFFSRLLHNRNDGAFVRVSAITEGEKIPEAKKRVTEFAEEILSLLPKYWPEEK